MGGVSKARWGGGSGGAVVVKKGERGAAGDGVAAPLMLAEREGKGVVGWGVVLAAK